MYTGVTSDLGKRIYAQKEGLVQGFTKKHKVHPWVYYEVHWDIYEAITRENKSKNGIGSGKSTLLNKIIANGCIWLMDYCDNAEIH